jgi:hypothetical protein
MLGLFLPIPLCGGHVCISTGVIFTPTFIVLLAALAFCIKMATTK